MVDKSAALGEQMRRQSEAQSERADLVEGLASDLGDIADQLQMFS
jgi:hypothetical protein